MRKNIKEETLIECLKWAQIPTLPEEDDKENVWINAIALVQKSDGSENYAIMKKDDKLGNRLIKDFGNIAVIRKIKAIYPYSYLRASYVPEFKTRKKEERIDWLRKHDVVIEGLEELSLKELDKKVLSVAMRTQENKEKQLK